MKITSLTSLIVIVVVFILTFFIYFHETNELFSSLTGAIFSAVLVLGVLIVVSWFTRVFKK